MSAFFGQHQLKWDTVRQLQGHYEADEIVQGVYWENGKGCGVGCTVHSYAHSEYERQLGLPQALAYLEEHIFENLPPSKAKSWPLEFIEAIPVGVDLSLVCPEFLHWLLVDPRDGVIQFTEGCLQVGQAILVVDELVQRYIRHEQVRAQEWRDVRGVAWDAIRALPGFPTHHALEYVAWCAGEALRAAWAAGATEWAAGDIAWAARSAQGARPSRASRATALTRQRAKLLELLRACKVPGS